MVHRYLLVMWENGKPQTYNLLLLQSLQHPHLQEWREKIPLATLKVIRANLGSNGKPTNMDYHNLTVHINLYVEEEACITNIQLKVREEMADNKLVIVGANGLVIFDQEGTRGNPKPIIFELVYSSLISLVQAKDVVFNVICP